MTQLALPLFAPPPTVWDASADWPTAPGRPRVRYWPPYTRSVHADAYSALFETYPVSALTRLLAGMDPAEAIEVLETLTPPRTVVIDAGPPLEASWGARVVMLHQLRARLA